MDFETAKGWIKSGEKVYSDMKKPEEGFLGSIPFGTKLDDGIFYELMRKGVISLVCVIDGVGEFSK